MYAFRVISLTDGGIVDVVVCSNHSKVEWGQVHLILYGNTLHVDTNDDRCMYTMTQMMTGACMN